LDENNFTTFIKVFNILAKRVIPGDYIGWKHQKECILLRIKFSLLDNFVSLADQIQDAQIMV